MKKNKVHPEFDFDAQDSRDARDEGIELVLSHTPEYWRLLFTAGATFLIEQGTPFTLEEVRPICGPPPNHPNAYSAMCNVVATRALKEGLIAVVGHTSAQRKSSHACLLPIYCGIRPGVEVKLEL